MNLLKLILAGLALMTIGCTDACKAYCASPQVLTGIVVPHPQIEVDGHEMDDYIVVFSATWCQPCKALKPEIEALRKEGILIYVVDVDKDKSGSQQRMGVTSLPTIIVMSGGQERNRMTGARTRDQLRAAYNTNVINPDSGNDDGAKPDDNDPGIELPKPAKDYKVI